ncbi:hypothetical protein PUMCH_002793 [Australozyma saopauloensis]|uniref:Protoheme IX farnesyltransferase, mitochondrial n=1 Tax=Australozyma saopauloensis TaxID=291208 RepID=A0AAX4HB24_9ASCO|nr:hypothetical protein PUMCH_002793 [[Candida] saopauloensis]
MPFRLTNISKLCQISHTGTAVFLIRLAPFIQRYPTVKTLKVGYFLRALNTQRPPELPDNNNESLGKVASKILSCQDSGAASSQSLSEEGKPRIPFEAIPKKATSVAASNDTKKLLKQYFKLTKPNLTLLVTLSSICSYAISPNSVSIIELIFLTAGTALCSGSANAINMGREPEFDRKMTRTSTRPVVIGAVTPRQAFQFALATGSLGVGILYLGVNPVVAFLGFLNIGLYGWTYTSLKRRSILNTWVGAIVGAIPPLMGWAASTTLMHPGAWSLAALLYAWQFPHFNALSHNIADQYKGAGYVMTAAENPKLNARVALRYSLLMFPICFSLSYFNVTDWFFAFDSSLANGWLAYLAFQFWRQQRKNHAPNHTPSAQSILLANVQAKKLFWCSVWQLPMVLVLAMLHKKGQWDRLWDFLQL